MRLDVETLRDFLQYYSGQFVKCRVPDTLLLVHGASDEVPNAVAGTEYLNGRANGTKHVPWKSIHETIFFGLPKIGMTVYKDELLYLYYETNRNGSRGFARDRVQHHAFNTMDLVAAGRTVFSRTALTTAPFVHMALRRPSQHTNDMPSRLATIFDVEDKNIAYVITDHLGVYWTHDEYPKFCYRTEVVGSLLDASTIKIQERFRQYVPTIHRALGSEVRIT